MMVVGSDYAPCSEQGYPPVHPATLDNGVEVIFRECPGSATVACGAFVQVSTIRESTLTAGIRQVIQLMLVGPPPVVGGSPQTQQPVGINLEGATTRDYVEVIAQCLPEDLPAALALLRRRVFEAQFTPYQFQIARQRLRHSLAVRRQILTSLSLDTLVRRLYPAQPGSWPLTGSFAAAGAMRLEQVQQFYEQHFLPNATVIVVTGPLTREQVLTPVKEMFEMLLPGDVNCQPPLFSAQTNLPKNWRAAIRGSSNSIVVMGGRGPTLSDSGYPAAAVLAAVLGSGMGSRLYQSLRSEHTLAYSIDAGLTPSQACSYAYVLATCSAANLDAVQQLIDDQLQDICRHGPSAQQLGRAQRYLQGSFALNQQSSRDLAHYLGMFSVCGDTQGIMIHQRFPQLVAAVTRQDVQEACREIFAAPAVIILQGTGQHQVLHRAKQWRLSGVTAVN